MTSDLRYIVLSILLCLGFSGHAQSIFTSTGGGGNWNSAASWTENTQGNPADGNGWPDANDDVIIATGDVITIANSGGRSCNNLTLQGSGNLNYTTNKNLQVGGNLSMSGTSSITGTSNGQRVTVTGTFDVTSGTGSIGGVRFTITGQTTITGTVSFTSTTGNKTFGNITIASGGTWDNSVVAEDFAITGNIANNSGTWNGCSATTGCTYTLSSTTGTITGAGTVNMADLTINSPASITNTGNLTLSDDLTGSGTFINGNGGTLTLTENGTYSVSTLTLNTVGNTVVYSGTTNETIDIGPFYDLEVNMSTAATRAQVNNTDVTVNNDLTITRGLVRVQSANTLAVSGDVTITTDGELNPNNASAVLNITGDLIMTGGDYDHNNGDVNVTGDITITGGTMDLTNAASTMDAVNMAVTTGTVLINNGTLTLTGALTTSSGSFTQANGTVAVTGDYQVSGGTNDFNGGTLTVGSLTVDASQSITLGNVDLTANGTSTVNGTVTVDGGTGDKDFNNLTFANSGNLNFTSNETVAVGGDLAMSGTSSLTGSSNNHIVSVTGALNVTSGMGSIGGIQLNVTGTTTVDGTLSFTSTTGNKTLGNVTVGASGTWDNGTVTEVFTFTGNLVNNGGTWTACSTTTGCNYTMTATSGTISGAGTINVTDFVIDSPASITNNGTVVMTDNITGTGTFINGVTGTLTLSDNGNYTLTTLTLNTVGNLVIYAGSTNTDMIAGPYYNLEVNMGTPTTQADVDGNNVTVNNDLTLTQGLVRVRSANTLAVINDVSITADTELTLLTNASAMVDIDGNLNVTGGTLDQNLGTIDVAGNLTVSTGTLTMDVGTSIFGVTGIYQVSGGTNDFNAGALTIGSLTVDASQSVNFGGLSVTAGGTSTINGTMTIDGGTGDKNFAAITLANSGNINFTSNETLTLSGTLSMSGTSSITGSSNNHIVNAGTTFDVTSGTGSIGGIQLNVTGLTTVAGTLDMTNSSGNKTLADLTVSGSGIVNFAVTETLNVGGNLNMSGTSSLTGTSNNHFVDVTGTFDVPSGSVIIGGVRLDVSGLTTIAGTMTLNSTSGNKTLTNLTISGSGNINYTANETISVSSNLIMLGSSSVTGSSNNQVLDVTGTFGVTSGTASIGGMSLTIGGATTLDGTLAFTSTTGNKTFSDITVNGSGNWNNSTVAEDFTISGNIANNGTWTGCNANGCNYTLTSSSGTISGSGAMNATSDILIDTPGSYTNTNTGGLFVTDRITGTGTFINGANGSLNYSGNNSGGSNFDITNFTASATGNTVTFSRSGDMQMRTTTDTDNNYHNVIISTSAAGNDVSLAGNITIDNQLTLTLGDVILDANRLTIADGATISGGDANSFIRLNSTGLVRQNYTAAGATLAFPIGDGGDFAPITALTITSATFGASPYLEFSITDAAHPNRNTSNTGAGGDDTGTTAADRITRYWTIAPNDITSPRFNATYIYIDGDVVGTEADMAATIYRTHPTLGILDWLVAGSVNPTNNTVSLANVDAFGDLYAMDNASDRLPIVLLSFEAQVLNESVQLVWSTASEIDNEIYTVERSSNGIDFTPVLFREGAGNSAEVLHYTIVDPNPIEGRSYYRLKQTDFNGTFEYSEVISVFYASEATRFKVFPNPISHGQVLNINTPGKVGAITIRNLNGQVVKEISDIPSDQGSVNIIWQADWPSGLYLVGLRSSEGIQTKKLIVK